MGIEALAFLLLVVVSAAAGWYLNRGRADVHVVLKRINTDMLQERFGPRMRKSGSVPDGTPWHRMLRYRDTQVRAHDSAPLELRSDALLMDSSGHYWHCLVTGIEDAGRPQAVFTALTELRARRALFNDRRAYRAAFGEFPDRQHIDRLLGKPLYGHGEDTA